MTKPVTIEADDQGRLPSSPGGVDGVIADTATEDARSQFEKIRDYIAGQIGAVRQVEAGQQSAELLLELAEGELGDLKRDFAAARLGAPKT